MVKIQELSKTRLDRLAKGAFVKVGSMAWDVWIHTCSHRFLGCGYDFEGFHGCIAMVFLLNNTWWWILLEVGFFPQWGFSKVYLMSQFLWVCSLFFYMWILILYLFQIYYGLCGNFYIPCCQVSLQVVSELWLCCCNPRLNPWECMRG